MASPRKVVVFAEQEQAKTVTNALQARINGTERYQTVENFEGQPELVVSIICFSMEKYQLNGEICSYSFLYVPVYVPHLPVIMLNIGTSGGRIAGQRPEELAERIFQEFVENTTEAKIRKNRAISRSLFSCSAVSRKISRFAGRNNHSLPPRRTTEQVLMGNLSIPSATQTHVPGMN